MKKTIVFICLLILQFSLVMATTYDRCTLARSLVFQHNIEMENVADWICIIEQGSHFNTEALRSSSYGGSSGHGLFQIPDIWCGENREINTINYCQKYCSAFRDESLTDDVLCVKQIFEETEKVTRNGFTAWRIWKSSCRGKYLDSYIADCFQKGKEEFPNSIEFEVTTSPIKMTSRAPANKITTRRSRIRKYPRIGKSHPRQNSISSATEAPLEAIKIYKCQDSYMKCEYRPTSSEYPYRCTFTSSEVAPY